MRGLAFNRSRLACLSRSHGIACYRPPPDAHRESSSGVWQAAKRLGVVASTVRRRIQYGFGPTEQITPIAL